MMWPAFLLGLALAVVLFGEPRPVSLIVGGLAAATAAYDMIRRLER